MKYSKLYLHAYLLLVLIAGLAYLPYITKLGYYHDDWFTIASRVGGVSIADMESVDRPGVGIVYGFANQFLSESPISWNLYSFILRTLGGIFFFNILCTIWKKQITANWIAALLFTVYPGFLLQPSANNYSNQFLGIAIATFSIWLTVLGVLEKRPGLKIFLLLISAVLAPAYVFIYEGLLGIEALRIAFVWILIARSTKSLWKKLWQMVLNLIPAGVGLLVFIRWRAFIFVSSRAGIDSAELISQYLSSPLEQMIRILSEGFKDLLESTVIVWGAEPYRVLPKISTGDLFTGIVLAGISFMAVILFSRLSSSPSDEIQETNFIQETLIAGSGSLVISLLALLMFNRHIEFTYNYDRYTLQSMGSVAILSVNLLWWIGKSITRKWVCAFFVFLAVLTQVANGAVYADQWALTRDFWWQVSWRAPGIKPDTVLVTSFPSGYKPAEDFEVWTPANRIYYPKPINGQIALKANLLNESTIGQIIREENSTREWRLHKYVRKGAQTLLLTLPTVSSCVHFMDGNAPEISLQDEPLVRLAAPHSQLNNVRPEVEPVTPPEIIFGVEPAHTWCYYYQKAALARQKQEWKTVLSLLDEARQAGYEPANPVEWLPFIDAAVHTSDLTLANQLAENLRENTEQMNLICHPTEQSQPQTPLLSFLCVSTPTGGSE